MSIQYDRYLTQHIKNVGKGLAWLRTNLPDILREGEFPEVNYDLQFQQHDASKYDKEEYDAYDAYFYGPTQSYRVVQNFNRAWLHHIHHNPHHWQHWVLLEDDPSGGNVCIEMPHCYVVEMICDWWAFSWAKDDLTEIFSWWDKHKDIVQLHKNTRKTVLDILERIKAKLEEESEDSLAHHGIKGQKWGVRRTPEELGYKTAAEKQSIEKAAQSDIIATGKSHIRIPKEKLYNYALDYDKAPDKARAFEQALGYTKDNCQDLIRDIEQNLDTSKFVPKGDTGYGMRYEYVMQLTGPNQKKANVLTAWIDKQNELQLTSLYVTNKEETK